MKQLFLAILLSLVSLSIFAAQSKEPTSYNYQRGIEAIQEGHMTEGIEYLQRALSEDPKSGHIYAWLASAYGSQRNKGQALTYVNKALQLLPKRDKKYQSWVYGMRAMINEDLNDIDAALEDYSTAIKITPTEISYYQDRANLYFNIGRFEEAGKDYQKMIELDPGNEDGYMGFGRTLMEHNRLDEAIEVFTRVILLNPRYALAHSYRADCYIQEKLYDEAADDLIQAIGIDDDTKANILLLKFTSEQQYALMKTKLQIKMATNPNVPLWFNCLASLQQTVNDFAGALETYQKAKVLDPSEQIDQEIAQCYYLIGDYEQALRTIDGVLAMDSTNPGFLLLKANILHFGLGRTQETVDICSQLIDLHPGDFQAYYYRGWFRLYTSEIAEAVEDLNVCLTLNRRYTSGYLTRGRAYEMLGQDSLAALDFQKTIETDNSFLRLDAQYAKMHLGMSEEVKAYMDSIPFMSDFYDVACIYSLLQDSTQSISYLEKAFVEGELSLSHIMIDSDLAYTRSTQLFADLLTKWESIVETNQTPVIAQEDDKGQGYSGEHVIEVPFTRVRGVTKVECSINGLPLSFILDTGASDVTLSQVEANFMYKNGYLEERDIIGKKQYRVANGGLTEGTVINLRNINFGGLTLTDVRASVVGTQNAPLLLGQSVLRRLGKIEIDNERRVLLITQTE